MQTSAQWSALWRVTVALCVYKVEMKSKPTKSAAAGSKNKVKKTPEVVSGPTLSRKLRDKTNGETSKSGMRLWKHRQSSDSTVFVTLEWVRVSSRDCSQICRSPEERLGREHTALYLQEHSGPEFALTDETGKRAWCGAGPNAAQNTNICSNSN